MSAICVDAGTTMIKAVGYDDDGNEVVVVRQQTSVTRPQPGWAQQDMASVWDAVLFAVRGAVAQLPGPVSFVAITAQGDGAWLVDEQVEPTGPAILWNDGRSSDIVAAWTRSGTLEQAFRRNGSLGSTSLPNAILTWLHQHDPQRLERSAACLTCGGWLLAKMTGVVAIDESDAAAPFLDIRTRTYSRELLDLFEMDWAERLLPRVLGDDERRSELSSAAAIELNLPAGTPVVLSSYDIASTAIGVGAVEAGQACSILGTTLCTEMVVDEVVTDGDAGGLTVALGLPGRYLRAFPTLAGGEVIEWACRQLDLDDPFELGALAEQARTGADGLVFLPYLSPAGERAPFLDGQARGALLGLSLEHGRPEIARAVMEGLTYVVYDCLRASPAEPTELRVCGGGAASTEWLRLIADITGVPVMKSQDSEVGAKGAFLVGNVATGAATEQEAVERFVRVADRFDPQPGRSAFYREAYADFLQLRADNAASWPLLAQRRERGIAYQSDREAGDG